MEVLGFSLDNLSMMALILSIGFVVDDAIVMLENIVRHMEQGETPLEAALKGSKEIGFTIVTMTVSLAAVFIPILFMGGILGRLFREFAVTITTAILISGVVSMTLTPMLCSRFLTLRRCTRRAASAGSWSGCSTALLRGYERSLGAGAAPSSRHAGGVRRGARRPRSRCSMIVPKGFVPEEDNDSLNINLQRGAGHLVLRDGRRTSQQVADIVDAESERRHVLRQHRRRLRVDEHGALQRAAAAAARAAGVGAADRAAAARPH